MTELDPSISVRIRSAAADCHRLQSAMKKMEAANMIDSDAYRKVASDFEKAQQRMVEASMSVNRGVTRRPPS